MKLYDLQDIINIDIKGSLERFSNYEPMYLKYLKKFVCEPTFDEFLKAIDSGNAEAIENTAHTLKGICGNLGLSDLFDIYNKIVQEVRKGDLKEAQETAIKAIDDTKKYKNALAKLD